MKHCCLFFVFIFSGLWLHAQRSKTRDIVYSKFLICWEATGRSASHVSGVKSNMDTLDKLTQNAIGFPIVFHRVEHYYYWGDMPNSYLVRHQNQYAIVDSTLSIIIPFSDTIVPLVEMGSSDFPLVVSESDNSIHYTCYFQAITGQMNALYDSRGNRLTAKNFKGLIYHYVGNRIKGSSVLMTYEIIDGMFLRKGMIAADGTMLIPNAYQYIEQLMVHKKDSIFAMNHYEIRGESALESYSFYSLAAKKIKTKLDDVTNRIDACHLYIYRENGLYGLYHPIYGIMLKAKYRSIRYQRSFDHRGYDELMLEKQNGKKHAWKAPRAFAERYPDIFFVDQKLNI